MKTVLADREIKVIIGGLEYDCLLIPTSRVVDIDYRNSPQDHPKVKELMKKIKNGEL